MCKVFLFLGCLDVLFFSSHPALRSFSEPTQCRDPITGDRQDTEQLSLLPLQWHRFPAGFAASKKSSRIQLGKQCLCPQGFSPKIPVIHLIFHMIPPRCHLPRFEAASDFPFGRSRTHSRQLLFPSSGGKDPQTPQSSMQVQAHPNFRLLGCLLPLSPQNSCPCSCAHSPGMAFPRDPAVVLRWLCSNPP